MKTFKKTLIALAALLLAAPLWVEWPTPVDPTGPNSGAGRTPLAGEPTSGAGYALAAAQGRDPLTGEPASGAGRDPFTGEPTSGAGRALA